MLTEQEFVSHLREVLKPGLVLENPKKGITTILAITDENLRYMRGTSTITVNLEWFYKAYQNFYGKRMSSTDLRKFAPTIFDPKSSGHSCNCTLLFMALKEIGAVDKIHGKGVKGNPFYVDLKIS